MKVAGIDRAIRGWLAAVLDEHRAVSFAFRRGLPELLDAVHRSGCDVVAVDIPLGLVDQGPRQADVEARRQLPSYSRSSVFSTPPASVVYCHANNYAEARAVARSQGVGLTAQAWSLCPSIIEARHACDVFSGSCVEIHPELVFQVLASGEILAPKKTWEGFQRRVRLLEMQGLSAFGGWGGRAQLPCVDDSMPGRHAAPDDVGDASAAALAAEAFANGEYELLGRGDPAAAPGPLPEIVVPRRTGYVEAADCESCEGCGTPTGCTSCGAYAREV